jgi:hypothetical protein
VRVALALAIASSFSGVHADRDAIDDELDGSEVNEDEDVPAEVVAAEEEGCAPELAARLVMPLL